MTGHPVRTHDLTIRYGSTPAVTDVSLGLGANRIHGLLGRNGAGKTTLLSALASLRPPASGSVEIAGGDPFENGALMEDVCLIRESGDVLGSEKIRATLSLCEAARPHFDRAYANELLDRVDLPLKKTPDSLSRGQKSALGAVIGLASRAPVTIFDEVHLGMDAPSRYFFYDELLADFTRHPRTIILSTHLISEVEHLLETVTILHEGRMLLSDEADTLRSQGATVTGPAAQVDRATAGQPILATEDLGPTRRTTLFGTLKESDLDEGSMTGLSIGPIPLQDLFVHLTSSPMSMKESA